MDADYEYLATNRIPRSRSASYRQNANWNILRWPPSRPRGAYWRLAFLPFDTLTLELSARCPVELLPEIEAHSAKLIARRGERFGAFSDGQNIVLGGEGADLGEAGADIAS